MEKKKPGQPTKFNESLSERILDLAEKGKTDRQIADIIGVTERTLNNWKGKHTEFFQSLKESKQAADELVEASLFSRAVGYKDEYQKEVVTKIGDVIQVTEKVNVPPDTTAAIFWLKNRQPDKWRDKTELDLNDLRDVSDEELKKRLAAKLAKMEQKK